MRNWTLIRITALAATALLVPAGAVLAGPATISGSLGADTLVGTDGPDRIVGLAGNDEVHAKKGGDRVRAGHGADTVYAGRGADRVFGNGGDDELRGGPGRDRLLAQAGVDVLYGGLGNDDLWAQARPDVKGQVGEPSDTLNGGPVNDRFHVRDGEADRVTCGPGFDRVLADHVDITAADCERVRRAAPHPRADDRG